MKRAWKVFFPILLAGAICGLGWAKTSKHEIDDRLFRLKDVFHLEYASDPQISPEGQRIVYMRNFMDIMTDRRRSNLWTVGFNGSGHRPLTTGNRNESSPRWSPDGTQVLFVSSGEEGTAQLWLRWFATGERAKLTNLTSAPSGLAWSPDGKWIAFSMLVRDREEPLAKLPDKPEGAEWAEPPKVIRKLIYRYDGQGYLKDGFYHLFVVSSEGGTPRQITNGPFHHKGTPVWTPDNKALIFSANRHENWEHDPRNSEIHEVSVVGRRVKPLTDRKGPDESPALSPDGRKIAYVGFDDRVQGYQARGLYVMNRDGSGARLLTSDLNRSVADPVWSQNGQGIYFQYDDEGNTKIGYITLAGEVQTLAEGVGGTTLGRPYSSGSFSVSRNDRFTFTQTDPERPADVAVGEGKSELKQATQLNEDLFGHKKLGAVEEIWFESSHDNRKIQGWIVKPPDFDLRQKYPLILEIHGGPFANYGDRFSAEMQLYAAEGYVVLYINPRGSTGYGEEFGNLIHHAYPGQDYDDLMSGVGAVIERGYIDEDHVFITGGSGGGVLTSWTIGKTDRFRAAVVGKPVINWYSFVLTSDAYNFFYRYWFPGLPWEHADHYMRRSPISLVGNVTTPTMVITGESDYRTPISESEQYYQALQLQKVESRLVRVPGASHDISKRPSQLMAKVAHVLKWFEMHRNQQSE